MPLKEMSYCGNPNFKGASKKIKNLWELRVLADKAYPEWKIEQRQILVRDQFIHGLHSPKIQLELMKETPTTVGETLELAQKQLSLEVAQKQLLQQRHCSSSISTLSVNTSSECMAVKTTDKDIESLREEIKRLTEEVARLHSCHKDPITRATGRGVCWNCGKKGHIRRNCPSKGQGTRPKMASPIESYSGAQPMCVNGFIESKPVKMMVDTGSAITLIRQDCLPPKFACSVVASPNPVVVANGGRTGIVR